MISIQLPDGSKREFASPPTVSEVAASIGSGLAKAAIAGRVGEGVAARVVDTSYRLEADTPLAIVTAKDADGLEVIRHSTAHLLAYAVKELFPDAQVTIGPVIENGFYYDFAYKRPFTPEDLAAIESKMAELAAKDEPVVRRVLPRDEAVAYFKGLGEHYKAEIIASIPAGEEVSLYREGAFEDLCRGPHVPSTGKLKHFKLMKVAGAYWRGDHRNEMLQRIYGTAWATKDELQQYLHRLEEAEKRDHRRLGRELDLFHLDEHAPRTQDPVELTAQVRVALGRSIVQQLYPGNADLSVIALDPSLERVLLQAVQTVGSDGSGIEPGLADTLLRQTAAAAQRQEEVGLPAVLLVPGQLRWLLSRFLRRAVPQLKVIANAEVPDSRTIKVTAIIGGK